jgi:hypothetical protein
LASVQAEVQDLRRKLHERGYDTKPTGGGHFQVYKPNGDSLTTSKGQPITIPSTPNSGALNRTVAQLRDLGALPKVVVPKKATRRRLKKDELKAKTAQLRGDMEQVMVDYGLQQTDIYHYANYYAAQNKIPAPGNPQGIVSKLHKGQTSMMNDPYWWLRAAIDAIKAANGRIPRAEEIRAMTNGEKPPAPTPAPKEVGVEVEGRSAPKIARSPKLAIEAMRWIYAAEKDDDRIEQLINDIAKVELGEGS